jgi:hypothetical protein
MITKSAICLLLLRVFCFACPAQAVPDPAAPALAAYYTRVPIENDDPPTKVGRHADVVVRLDDARTFVFARDSSYLPCLVQDGKKTYVDELVARRGDGDAKRPDRINRYSHVRIIENTPQQVVVHWRYMEDFANVEWDGVVDELFTLRETGEVRRVVRRGTRSKREWDDPANRHIQTFRLTANGIEDVQHTPPRLTAKPGGPTRGRPVIRDEGGASLIRFAMDDGLREDADRTFEAVSGHECRVDGHRAVWREGISGTSLLFDGYDTRVSFPAEKLPAAGDGLTVESWVALGAYPFNWAPIVHQSEWEKSGYYLGVNGYGHLGFKAHIGGEWRSLQASSGIHETDIKLFRWHHVAATHDGETLRLYLDGKEVATMAAPGKISRPDRDLVIGRNLDKLKPTSPIREWATYPSIFGIDGLIDEVVVRGTALGAEDIARRFQRFGPVPGVVDRPDLEPRNLPANPQGRKADAFGAGYANLPFHAGFDHLWRVGDFPDVVVGFDQHPCRVVFWKGLRYAPALVTENGKWSGDQSAETGGNWGKFLPFDHPEAVGCCEHMSDAQARHSHVRILENTPARVVVHWRYAEIDVRYVLANAEDGWGAWADEYYSIYPDGAAIRHVARNVGGWQETLFYNAPGTRPEDNVHLDAYTLVNAEGNQKTYSWATAPDPFPAIPGELDLAGGPFVSMVHFKSSFRPYYIYESGSVRTFSTEVRADFSRFPWWNHYPVSQAISDGRSAERADRMTHSSLVWGKPGADCMMVGLTDRKPADLLPLAKSWARSPEIEVLSGATSSGYRLQRRDYPLVATGPVIRVRLAASDQSPVRNLCFTVSNWGHRGDAEVEVVGRSGVPVRQGVFFDTDGTPTLVVFVELATESPVEIQIHGARPAAGAK